MFVGFELRDYQSLSTANKTDIDQYKSKKLGELKPLEQYVIGQFKNSNVLEAKEIAKHLFPEQEVHVFLSHSHADEDKAIELAIALEKKGISVFVDSCVWGYFHTLIDEINLQCYKISQEKDSVTFDYRKSIQTAAGAHIMLAGALHKAIDMAELFIFLHTDNSVPMKEYDFEDKTFSPWIHSELRFSYMVEHSTPPRRALRPVFESFEEKRQIKAFAKDEMVLAYEAFNKHLPLVRGRDLKNWYNYSLEEGEELLDVLYDDKEYNLCKQYWDTRSILREIERSKASDM